jgi:hypothetical protein
VDRLCKNWSASWWLQGGETLLQRVFGVIISTLWRENDTTSQKRLNLFSAISRSYSGLIPLAPRLHTYVAVPDGTGPNGANPQKC